MKIESTAFGTFTVNLNKLDKSRLFTGENGELFVSMTINILEKPTDLGRHFVVSQANDKLKEKEAISLGWGKFQIIDGAKIEIKTKADEFMEEVKKEVKMTQDKQAIKQLDNMPF